MTIDHISERFLYETSLLPGSEIWNRFIHLQHPSEQAIILPGQGNEQARNATNIPQHSK